MSAQNHKSPNRLDPNRPIDAAKFLNDERLGQLKQFINNHEHDPYCLILDVLLSTGCRVDEACRIEAFDVDEVNGFINIRAAKRSIDRKAPASIYLCRKIKKFYEDKNLDVFKPLGELIANSENIESQKAMMRAFWGRLRRHLWRDLVSVGLHSLRHSYAVYVYSQERDLWAVKTALGHRSVKSTERYMPMFLSDRMSERLRTRFSK